MNVLFYVALLAPVVPTALLVVDTRAAYAVIPFTVWIVAREALVASSTLLRLLVRRVAFMGGLLVCVVWVVITTYVLGGGDARVCVAIHGFVVHATLLLHDASTMRDMDASTWLNMVSACRIAPVFVLSLYLLLDLLPGTEHAILAVSQNAASSGNDVQAVDLAQLAGDLGLFSIALPTMLRAAGIRLWFGTSGNDWFSSIASPVMPVFDQDDDVVLSEETLRHEVDHLVLRMVEDGGGDGGIVASQLGGVRSDVDVDRSDREQTEIVT
jgi:hypothetical protein